MALHLNWDGNQNNGIIFNDTYLNGALFTGVENKPTLAFTFDSFLYTEVFPKQLNYVEENDVKRVMTADEEAKVATLASTWVQPLGQEGNPTIEQAKTSKTAEITQAFNEAVKAMTTAQDHVMVSWRKQEKEARAYTADNTVATPFLDAQVATRQLDTKDELVAKIIAKTDAYEVAYAGLLGKSQNLMNKINTATTVDELNVIGW